MMHRSCRIATQVPSWLTTLLGLYFPEVAGETARLNEAMEPGSITDPEPGQRSAAYERAFSEITEQLAADLPYKEA